MHDFHNRLRIMRGIDAHEFEAVGLTLDQWRRFDADPFDFFIRADDPTAEAIWSIVEARSKGHAMTDTKRTSFTPGAWEGGKCRVPMWMGGCPAGHCGEQAFGPQYPREYLAHRNARYRLDRPPYCFGPCCPKHEGPGEGEPIIFQDGVTESGRPMWCAVMPGFINLQESEAAFDGNPVVAVAKLRAALATGKEG